MNRFIKPIIIITVILVVMLLIFLLILNYDVEGEKYMPFNLTRIMIVSSAEGKVNVVKL